MSKEMLHTLQIPIACKVDKKLYKKQFLENFSLKPDEKKILSRDVESITLNYLLNKENINIEPIINKELDYSEIAFIQVELSDDKHYKKISCILQNIPYMVILVLTYHDNFCINISPKRVNQQDSTKLLVEDTYFTEWIDSTNMGEKEKIFLQTLEIQNQSFSNFEHFYLDMLNKLIAFNLSKDSETLIIPRETNKEALDTISILEEQIKESKSKIQKESHFSDKVTLNIELKVLYDRLSEVKDSL